MTHNEFIPTEHHAHEEPTSGDVGPYYNGVATCSRNETLSSISGGGESARNTPSGNSSVGMRATWSEGSLTPTQAPGPGDLGGFKATTAGGAPISDLATLSENDLVTIGGETMSAEVALHLGFLIRDPKSGMIRSPEGHEAQPDAAQETQRDEQQNDGETPSALDDTSEAILAEAYEGAPGEALAAAPVSTPLTSRRRLTRALASPRRASASLPSPLVGRLGRPAPDTNTTPLKRNTTSCIRASEPAYLKARFLGCPPDRAACLRPHERPLGS